MVALFIHNLLTNCYWLKAVLYEPGEITNVCHTFGSVLKTLFTLRGQSDLTGWRYLYVWVGWTQWSHYPMLGVKCFWFMRKIISSVLLAHSVGWECLSRFSIYRSTYTIAKNCYIWLHDDSAIVKASPEHFDWDINMIKKTSEDTERKNIFTTQSPTFPSQLFMSNARKYIHVTCYLLNHLFCKQRYIFVLARFYSWWQRTGLVWIDQYAVLRGLIVKFFINDSRWMQSDIRLRYICMLRTLYRAVCHSPIKILTGQLEISGTTYMSVAVSMLWI